MKYQVSATNRLLTYIHELLSEDDINVAIKVNQIANRDKPVYGLTISPSMMLHVHCEVLRSIQKLIRDVPGLWIDSLIINDIESVDWLAVCFHILSEDSRKRESIN